MASPLEDCTPPAHIADLLAMLPLDLASVELWAQLSAPHRRSFRLACKRMALLADQLITSAVDDLDLGLGAGVEGEDAHAAAMCSDEGPRSASQATRLNTALLKASFFARLPRLTCLTIKRWPTEADLVLTLQHYPPCLRECMRMLQLHGDAFTTASTCVIAQALPSLQELHLDRTAMSQLQGANFDPLHSVTALTRLSIEEEHRRVYPNTPDAYRVSNGVVRSLRGLSHLQRLDLPAIRVTRTNLAPLTALRSLTHCSIAYNHCHSYSIADVWALLTLTRLTHLQLHSVVSQHRLMTDIVERPVSQVAAALSRLGSLARLQCLELSDTYFVCNTAMAALDCMLQLTRLRVGYIDLTHPSRGHLSSLQSLAVLRCECLPPSCLLKQLLPLLPLPSLTCLHSSELYKVPLAISSGPTPEGDGDSENGNGHPLGSDGILRESAALRQLAAHLAAAPHLHLPDLHLSGYEPGLRLSECGRCLQPLGGLLTHLVLAAWGRREWLPFQPTIKWDGRYDWAALQQALPGLAHLTVDDCTLTDAGLAGALEGLPALQHLTVFECRCEQGPGIRWPEVSRALRRARLLRPSFTLSVSNGWIGITQSLGMVGLLWLSVENE